MLLGARNTPSAEARFSSEDEITVREITSRHFPDGFTVLNAQGGWFDPQLREFIEEESRQVIVCARSRRPLRAWLEELALALKQDELIVVEHGRAAAYKVRRGPIDSVGRGGGRRARVVAR